MQLITFLQQIVFYGAILIFIAIGLWKAYKFFKSQKRNDEEIPPFKTPSKKSHFKRSFDPSDNFLSTEELKRRY